MPENNHTPRRSPLTQAVTRDERTVQVEIYEDGEGGWILEVVDEHRSSTVWLNPFATDGEALDAALKTIADEGIDALIDEPPDSRYR